MLSGSLNYTTLFGIPNAYNHSLPEQVPPINSENILRQLSSLLRRPRSNGIHERRREGVICRQALGGEGAADVVHLVGIEALLDDGAHECGELGLLPALVLGELDVDEVEALEGVVLLDAAEEVDAALAAGVALDHSLRVDDLELVGIGGHAQLVTRHDGHDAEQRALGLPALGAPARVVVCHLTAESHLDWVA